MGNSENGVGKLLDARLLAAVSAIAYALGMFWLDNMWSAIEQERVAREALAISIGASYASRDQINEHTARIERNTNTLANINELLAQLRADVAALKAKQERDERDDRARSQSSPSNRGR